MLNVNHKITIGGHSFESGDSSRLLNVATHASLRTPVNACDIVLAAQDAPDVQAGDDVKVELGYDNSLNRVFTGKVSRIAYGVAELRVEALSSFTVLTTARFNLAYERQTAGDIVSDVLSRLAVTKNTVDPGV